MSSLSQHEYTVLHVCGGSGGAGMGFKEARAEFKGAVGQFRTLCSIDVDREANEDFRHLVGAPAFDMDLFTREDYTAFHGHEPPSGWKEAEPDDILAATGGEHPDAVFFSPPCKGLSGLLPAKAAASPKYQALNRLVPRSLRLVLDAFFDDPPAIILLENVPRITTRGAALLSEVKRLLGAHGYVLDEGTHECGEIGALAERRRRYLLMARLPSKVPGFVYRPPKYRLKAIGEVLGSLPLPDDTSMGIMHRLPRLARKTWIRLALIPAGGDWRDLQNIAPDQYRLVYIPRGGGSFGVQDWDKPGVTVTGNACVRGSNAASVADPRLAHMPREGTYRVQRFSEPSTTVTAAARVNGSNGAACVADPRLPDRDSRHPGVYQVVRWDEPGPCVTGTRFGSGAPAVADLRVGGGYSNKRRVLLWNEPATTVTGISDIQAGAQSIADPRVNLSENGHHNILRVNPWEKPGGTVTGATRPAAGALSVADPRLSEGTGVKFQGSPGLYGVLNWDGPAQAVTGGVKVSSSNCPAAVADPRLGCDARNGLYGVQDWNQPGSTITGARSVHSGTVAVADPRIPEDGDNLGAADDNQNGVWVIISEDGTWHRPLTTLELAVIQDFPVTMPDGSPLRLAGKSDARHRERIGNAVPRGAARAMAEQILPALMNRRGDFQLSNEGIWVLPDIACEVPSDGLEWNELPEVRRR